MKISVRILLVSCLTLLVASGSLAATVNVADWSGLQAAITGASAGDTISLAAGTYESTATISINKAVIVDGNGSIVNVEGVGKNPWRYVFIIPSAGAGATIQNFTINKTDKDGEFNMVAIQANDVTIQDNTFSGQYVIDDSEVTRAMEVSGGLSGLLIDGNTISGLRQAAYFNPGTVGTVSDNNVAGTKGWTVVGATITFTGNTWDTNVVDIYLGPGTSFGAPYDPLTALSTANNGANIEDGRTGVNPYRVTNTTTGTVYTAIQTAIDAATAGDVIDVAAGTYAENIVIDKALTIQGPQAGVLAKDRPGDEASVEPASGNAFVVNANDVTINGLAIVATDPAGCGILHNAGSISDLQVLNTDISGGAYGISIFQASNYTIESNYIHEMGQPIYTNSGGGATINGVIKNNDIGSADFGININCTPSKELTGLAIEENRLESAQIAVFCVKNASMKDNTISAPEASTGIYLGGSCDGVIIEGNTVATDADPGNSAIRISTWYSVNKNIEITGNTLNDAAFGVKATAGTLASSADLVFTGTNTINGKADGSTVGLWLEGMATGAAIDIASMSFAADLAEFIHLKDWTPGVTATNATFDGAATDQAIEERVYHDVDDATLGHVDWGQGAATECALVVSDLAGTVGQTLQLTAKLTVAGGAGIAGQPVKFQVDDVYVDTGTTSLAGVAVVPYTIVAGATEITATFADVSNYIATTSNVGTITAGAAKATTITLTLSDDDVTTGDTITCTVEGNNGVDYTDEATYYVNHAAAGTWADNVYTSAKAGDWTVTAVLDTLTDTADLKVNRGVAAAVTLTPEVATINAVASQEYVVTASDAAGNTWSPVDTLTSDGRGTFAGNTYTSDATDAGNAVTITATVDGVTDTATLNVNAEAGTGAILAWDKDDQEFYLCSNATDPATGTLITGSGTYTIGGVDYEITVSGGSTNVTVTVGDSSLRVQWYLRRGTLTKVYQYSSIGAAPNAVTETASYDGRKTLVDGTWKAGFWGLTHTISEEGVEYDSAQQ